MRYSSSSSSSTPRLPDPPSPCALPRSTSTWIRPSAVSRTSSCTRPRAARLLEQTHRFFQATARPAPGSTTRSRRLELLLKASQLRHPSRPHEAQHLRRRSILAERRTHLNTLHHRPGLGEHLLRNLQPSALAASGEVIGAHSRHNLFGHADPQIVLHKLRIPQARQRPYACNHRNPEPSIRRRNSSSSADRRPAA